MFGIQLTKTYGARIVTREIVYLTADELVAVKAENESWTVVAEWRMTAAEIAAYEASMFKGRAASFAREGDEVGAAKMRALADAREAA